MALVTAAAVGEKTDQIRSAFNAVLLQNGIVMERVRNQVELLKQKEKDFLDMFNVKTFDELNKKLNDIKADGIQIQNFANQDLEKEFLREARKYMTSTGKNLKNKEGNSYKKKQIRLFLEKVGRKAVLGADAQKDEVLAILNSFGPDIVNKVMKSLNRGGAVSSGVLTPSQLQRLTKILIDGSTQEVMKEVEAFNLNQELREGIDQYSTMANLTTGSDSLTVTVDEKKLGNVSSITLGLTETQAKEMAKKDPSFLPSVQMRFKNLLISKGPAHKSFKQAVDHVIESAGFRIFFGNNYLKGYTGLLGEIAGIYYLMRLFEDNYSPNMVQWTGGLRENGRDPHEDIKVIAGDMGFNIQVKNTRKSTDLLSKKGNEVFFSNRIITEEEFSQLEPFKGVSYGGGILGEDLPALIGELCEMFGFNQETDYVENESKWVLMPNSEFAPLRSRIETLYGEAEKVVQMAAATLMHMSVESEAAAGNIAFLVGGSSFYSASEILNNAISENSNFKVAFYGKTSRRGTIADYYNSDGAPYKKELVKYIKGYTKSDISVRMRSSYNFK